MYQNYIFDLYGTLIDVHTDEYSKNFFKKYSKWLRSQGFSFEWKQFYKMYTTTGRKHRDNATKEGKHIKAEIQIEDVFREVFAVKGYELSDSDILTLCEDFRNISLIYLRLFPDTLECLKKLKAAGKKI